MCSTTSAGSNSPASVPAHTLRAMERRDAIFAFCSCGQWWQMYVAQYRNRSYVIEARTMVQHMFTWHLVDVTRPR